MSAVNVLFTYASLIGFKHTTTKGMKGLTNLQKMLSIITLSILV